GRVELDGPHGGEPPAAGGARCPAGEPPARPGRPHGGPRLCGAGFGELPRDAVLLVHTPIGRATGGGGGGKGRPPPCRPPGPSPLRRIGARPLWGAPSARHPAPARSGAGGNRGAPARRPAPDGNRPPGRRRWRVS